MYRAGSYRSSGGCLETRESRVGGWEEYRQGKKGYLQIEMGSQGLLVRLGVLVAGPKSKEGKPLRLKAVVILNHILGNARPR